MAEKETQLKQLVDEQDRFKQLAEDSARTKVLLEVESLKNNLREREIQVQRVSSEVDELRKRLTQSQAELKGEAGELDLYERLTRAFPNDHFVRKKRGESTADLIQKIRVPSINKDTTIVFDNKQAETVTKQDIEKAKGYGKVHGTNCVVIVSANLPKRDITNGLFGEREGILLVHPMIVVEVTNLLRAKLIELARQAGGMHDRQSKEAKLYDYISSQEFQRTIEYMTEIYSKFCDLQRREEKYHQTQWKERKTLCDRLMDVANEIASGVDSITQNKGQNENSENQPSADIESYKDGQ